MTSKSILVNKRGLQEIIFAFDLGKNAGMVYSPGPFEETAHFSAGKFDDIKEELAIYKHELHSHYNENPYGPKQIIKVIFFMDKGGFRRVESALAEKRGTILGILYDLRFEYFIEVHKFNESAVYSQMRKLHPSPIKEKKQFTTNLMYRVHNLALSQDVADAALLYFYYLYLLKQGIVYEDWLTLK